MIYASPVKFGDVMTREQFIAAVEDHSFIDYDGFAHPAIDVSGIIRQDLSTYIYPSQIDKLPVDSTHVVWYNFAGGFFTSWGTTAKKRMKS